MPAGPSSLPREARAGRLRLARASRGSAGSMVATVAALAYAAALRARIAFDEEFAPFVCAGMRFGFARGGTTIGGAYLTGRNTGAATLRHEAVHAEQWARYGLGFVVRYLIEEVRHPMHRNRFEIEAGLVDGGYVGRVA